RNGSTTRRLRYSTSHLERRRRRRCNPSVRVRPKVRRMNDQGPDGWQPGNRVVGNGHPEAALNGLAWPPPDSDTSRKPCGCAVGARVHDSAYEADLFRHHPVCLTRFRSPRMSSYQLGDRGLEMTRLEIALQELGLYRGAIDDTYGIGLETAVRLYQNRKGLPATGVADERTMAMALSEPSPRAEAVRDKAHDFRSLTLTAAFETSVGPPDCF